MGHLLHLQASELTGMRRDVLVDTNVAHMALLWKDLCKSSALPRIKHVHTRLLTSTRGRPYSLKSSSDGTPDKTRLRASAVNHT
jgi:hypothetical protein